MTISKQVENIVKNKDKFELFGENLFSYTTKNNIRISIYVQLSKIEMEIKNFYTLGSGKHVKLSKEEELYLIEAFFPLIEKRLKEKEKKIEEMFNSIEFD